MIIQATKDDLQEIIELQYLAYQSEAELLNNYDIAPLKQTFSEIEKEFEEGIILKSIDEENCIIGSVRGKLENRTLYIGKLIVHPDKQGKGIGTSLLTKIEKIYSHERCELFTSSRSKKNICLYERMGYRSFSEKSISEGLKLIYLEK